MSESILPKVGISVGDINGVGPELVIRILSDRRLADLCTPIVFAAPKTLSFYRQLLGMSEIPFFITKNLNQLKTNKPNLFVCWDDQPEIKPGEVNETGGRFALKSLEAATTALKEGQIDTLVTAPLNKHNIPTEGDETFTGHTEFLARHFETEEYLMFMISSELKMGLVTGHVPLNEVANKISVELILNKLHTMKTSLDTDFGITKPKIAILGLNPHAGDNGLLGKEDLEIIAPAVKQAFEENILVYGPYSADGFFATHQYKKFDAVMAMYHDQGLIPFKHIAFEEGVNYTAGLPIIRTSPDHGTAYPLAGKNEASPASILNAIYLACDIFRNRKDNLSLKQNPLAFTPLRRDRFRIDF